MYTSIIMKKTIFLLFAFTLAFCSFSKPKTQLDFYLYLGENTNNAGLVELQGKKLIKILSGLYAANSSNGDCVIKVNFISSNKEKISLLDRKIKDNNYLNYAKVDVLREFSSEYSNSFTGSLTNYIFAVQRKYLSNKQDVKIITNSNDDYAFPTMSSTAIEGSRYSNPRQAYIIDLSLQLPNIKVGNCRKKKISSIIKQLNLELEIINPDNLPIDNFKFYYGDNLLPDFTLNNNLSKISLTMDLEQSLGSLSDFIIDYTCKSNNENIKGSLKFSCKDELISDAFFKWNTKWYKKSGELWPDNEVWRCQNSTSSYGFEILFSSNLSLEDLHFEFINSDRPHISKVISLGVESDIEQFISVKKLTRDNYTVFIDQRLLTNIFLEEIYSTTGRISVEAATTRMEDMCTIQEDWPAIILKCQPKDISNINNWRDNDVKLKFYSWNPALINELPVWQGSYL